MGAQVNSLSVFTMLVLHDAYLTNSDSKLTYYTGQKF